MERRTKGELGSHRFPDGAGFEPAGGFPRYQITQTQRPVEMDTPDGNRTHTSRIKSGCSVAVELRGDQKKLMGKWRDRTEALLAGNRTRSAGVFTPDATPSLWWRINDQLSAHRKFRQDSSRSRSRLMRSILSWKTAKMRGHCCGRSRWKT